MISVYNIKPKFQQLLLPVLKALRSIGVTANAITIAAILLSAATGYLFWVLSSPYAYILVALALLLRMALNALDGMMARIYNMQSRTGEVLNEVGDLISDIFIFLPFLKLPFVNSLLLFTFIALAIINEFSGVLSKAMGGTRRYDGPMGKSDRALVWGAWCLVLFFVPAAMQYTNSVLGFMIALLLVSTYTRLSKAIQQQ